VLLRSPRALCIIYYLDEQIRNILNIMCIS